MCQMAHWGELLIKRRMEKGLSQAKLADLSEVSRKAINVFETRGKTTCDTFFDILRGLGMSPAEFFESQIPTQFKDPEDQVLHEQLQIILEAGTEWRNGISLNIESIYRNLISKDPDELSKKASRTGRRQAS